MADTNLQKYLAFLYCVEHGSFTAAARQLHYSQANISRMVADLEQDWGVVLLKRDHNGVMLTSEGLQLFPYIQALGNSYQALQEQLEQVRQAAQSIPIFRSANMSLGINLLLKLLKNAAGVLAPAGFDMEILEKHHNLKADAPSGTALALADSINEEFGHAYTYVYDRSARREKRPEKEIGISAVRGGTIVGDHDVIFAGPDEVITFSHRAYSKAVFGKGAIQAAKFLAGRPAGKYDMGDVIDAAE